MNKKIIRFIAAPQPQIETAERILNEPGYAVRWAADHWRKNGVSHEH